MSEIQLRELNEALRKTAIHYIDRTIQAEAENDRLRQREQTIAKALGVCDGGEYVNDIVAAVERLQSANVGLREAVENLAEINCRNCQECLPHKEGPCIVLEIKEQALASTAPGVERQRKLEAVAEAFPKLLRDLCSPCIFGETTDCRGDECRIHIARRTLRKALAAVEGVK